MNLQELNNQILEARLLEPGEELKKIKEIKRLINQSKSDDASELSYSKALADTYIAEAYLRMGKIDDSLKVGTRATKIQIREKTDDLLMLNYNMLGHICCCMENYVNATNYFFAGIEIAEKLNDNYMLFILYVNYAEAFLRIEEYETAKELMDYAGSIMVKIDKMSQNKEFIESVYNERLATYYFGKGDYDKALEHMEKVEHAYNLMVARVALKRGDVKTAQETIDLYISKDIPVDYFLDQFEAYKTLIEITLAIRNEKQTVMVLEKLYECAQNCEIASFWVTYYSNKIKATELFGWEMDKQLFSEYYKYHQELASQRSHNEMIGLQIEMELFIGKRKRIQLQKKTERLEKMSRMDELTNVANRAGYQRYVRKMLHEAKNNRQPLGVCIIDIDYFKSINDTYGHLTGDECLKAVAKLLKKVFNNEAQVCRYGGDEFVILTINYSDEELGKRLEKLVNNPGLKNMIEKEITLSIGAVNCVPEADNTDTDYIFTADRLLYRVKNESRNAYKLENKLR